MEELACITVKAILVLNQRLRGGKQGFPVEQSSFRSLVLFSACSKSFSTIQSDDQSQGHRIALTAVADAISSLEDDDCLNAGVFCPTTLW